MNDIVQQSMVVRGVMMEMGNVEAAPLKSVAPLVLRQTVDRHRQTETTGNDDPTIVVPLPEERTLQAPDACLFHKVAMTAAIIFPFVGFVSAVAVGWMYGWFDWTQFGILLVGYLLTGFGITVGYHRLLTHRSLEVSPVMRGVWMILGALAVQKSPIEWCATHRKHHALSDSPGDPHSPHEHGTGVLNCLKGLWHAHAGWLVTGHIIKTDHVRYVPDLLQDRLAMFIHRTWDVLWLPLSFLIPTLASWALTGTLKGAAMGFLWGGCARIFLVQHVTFSVNSICHVFGTRDYQSSDESRNNMYLGLFTGGEAFHNNHHAFPTSARHGLEWWQIDLSWYVIYVMRMLGMAWNVKLPSQEMLNKKRLKTV